MSKRLFGLASVVLSILLVFPLGLARAGLKESVRELAISLARSIPSGFRVGVVELTAAGRESEKKASLLGLALADILATELSQISRGRFTVVERLQLRKLLREGELFGDSGPEAQLDLSKAGVRGLVTGTYLPSGSGVLVTARLVRLKDGTVLAAGSRSIPLDGEAKILLEREFPAPVKAAISGGGSSSSFLDAGVFYEAPNGRVFPVKDGMVLYRDDNYRIYFKPNRKAYVYVLQVDSLGGVFRLFPNATGRWGYRTTRNPIEDGVAVWAPAPPKFLYLDENPGREEIYFFSADKPIPVLDGTSTMNRKALRKVIKLMGVGGSRERKSRVEVKDPGGRTLSYETIRAKINTRGDLMYHVWFWHR